MSNTRSDGVTVQLIDDSGDPYGIKEVDGKPRVSSTPYLYDIGEGNITGHTPWTKIGYSPTVNTTESCLWSAAGVYAFPTSAITMEAASSDNTDDIGTIIKSGTMDAGGSTTTLIDAGVDFTTATAVAAGDCIIIDRLGTTPEWGYVTAVAANQLTFSGGLSSGGTCSAGRTYEVLDYSATLGAHAVKVEYLTSTYVESSCIIILNGSTYVDGKTDMYRVNSFSVIAAGANNKPTGSLTLKANAPASTVYSYILAGYTRARNNMYTVPYGKTLYITQWSVGWASPNDTKVQSARFFTRANMEPSTRFKTGNLFYPYTEIKVSNAQVSIHFDIPTKITTGIDIMVCGIADTGGSGAATSVLRGWTE